MSVGPGNEKRPRAQSLEASKPGPSAYGGTRSLALTLAAGPDRGAPRGRHFRYIVVRSINSTVMELGLYTFAELTPDPITGRSISPARAPAQPDRGGNACRRGRARRLRHRRAPSAGFRRLGPGDRTRSGGRADEAHPVDERRQRAQLGRSGARVPAVRDARPTLGRSRRDHGRQGLVHRVVPALRVRPRGLRRALRREARAPAAIA